MNKTGIVLIALSILMLICIIVAISFGDRWVNAFFSLAFGLTLWQTWKHFKSNRTESK